MSCELQNLLILTDFSSALYLSYRTRYVDQSARLSNPLLTTVLRALDRGNHIAPVGASCGSLEFANINVPTNQQLIFLRSTNESEIINIVRGLKNNRSRGIYNMNPRLVRYVIDVRAPYLESMFNKSLSRGKFPKMIKFSKSSAILKGSDMNVLSNHRPMSLSPAFSKCLGNITKIRLNSFILEHDIVNAVQHGFAKANRLRERYLNKKKQYLVTLIRSSLLLRCIYISPRLSILRVMTFFYATCIDMALEVCASPFFFVLSA